MTWENIADGVPHREAEVASYQSLAIFRSEFCDKNTDPSLAYFEIQLLYKLIWSSQWDSSSFKNMRTRLWRRRGKVYNPALFTLATHKTCMLSMGTDPIIYRITLCCELHSCNQNWCASSSASLCLQIQTGGPLLCYIPAPFHLTHM